MKNSGMRDAEAVIARLLAPGEGPVNLDLAWDLLQLYQRGAPVSSLRLLLHSSNPEIAGEAAWVASELPAEGSSLLPDVAALLNHPSRKARGYAVGCVGLWATVDHGELVNRAIRLVLDPDAFVVYQVLVLLSTAGLDVLATAAATGPKTNNFTRLTRWLVDSVSDLRPRDVATYLQSESVLQQRFAAAAAARWGREAKQLDLLSEALAASDGVASEFAASTIDIIKAGADPS